jgi:exopolysaccharide production protein ExoY
MSDTYLRSQAPAPGRGYSSWARAKRRGGVEVAVKRAMDILGAGALLLLTLPLLLAILVAVRRDGGPAIFRHTRIGLGGRPFACLKIRSMCLDAEARLTSLLAADPAAAQEWALRRKLSPDPRVTRVGAVLRATSLDELPQLLNVLRGEMSLVGPRPVVQAELDQHYSPAAAAAYAESRPGITGLWQIGGRSDSTYVERVLLDTRYARDRSLGLDISILLKTVPAVLARRGAV